MAVVCYPGSFDPMTIAHLAIVEAALTVDGVVRVDLVLSVDPLGKPGATASADRIADVRRATAHLPAAAIGVVATLHRLLADAADGYDALVLGADKWAQIQDVGWYGSPGERDAALARLPPILLVPRPGAPLPADVTVLRIDPAHAEVSSTAVRHGRTDWRAM